MAFFFHEFVPCMKREGDPARPLPPPGRPPTRPSSTAEGVLGVILLPATAAPVAAAEDGVRRAIGAAYDGVVKATAAAADGFECVGVLALVAVDAIAVVGGDTARRRSGDTSPDGERRVPAADRRFNDADSDVPAAG